MEEKPILDRKDERETNINPRLWRKVGLCSICDRPAPTGEAVIEVDFDTAIELQWKIDHHEFEARRKHAEAGGGLRLTTIADVPRWPTVEWEWNHLACSDTTDTNRGYSFDASRMSNSAEALGWTLHLYNTKTWMAATNWKKFVENLGFSSDS